ncbi:MAG: hypothetical protein A6D92_00415 [Symbiobacterium thermophilum]|uniref:Carbon monoxide dehydrogenase n=2 Tax=Symbiobacterium thermophilum TaxID=2734 RepID=Q67NG5_SYMTH|nr:SRPBCC domain-containing protein [Symbiobacterium thermophilum]OTA42268.1 MAG: hypothetical protein A6D92_00415 [Symbiobacterium thermophilum]BAD40778.1 conserved hypothetical protein [Symbiobacterium thermophilum IAM 14863]
MRVAGQFRFDAPPEIMYRLFSNKDALLNATIGLQSLEEVEPDRWNATLKVGIGGFALVYHGILEVTDRVPNESFHLHIAAETHNGSAEAEADLRFLPDGDGTLVTYEADIEFLGAQKLLPSLAKGLVDYFMHGMREYLEKARARALL